jgi:hypothetical protein
MPLKPTGITKAMLEVRVVTGDTRKRRGELMS